MFVFEPTIWCYYHMLSEICRIETGNRFLFLGLGDIMNNFINSMHAPKKKYSLPENLYPKYTTLIWTLSRPRPRQ